MRYGNLVTWMFMAVLICNLSLSAVSADERKEGPQARDTKTQTTKRTAAAKPIVYKPPRVGAPKGRMGGGTRGTSQSDVYPALYVLVPDHTGLTVDGQPSLFWYISRPTTAPIELTITREQAVAPLLEMHLAPPGSPGIQRIRLADYDVRLEPDIEYQWFVALVPDPQYRSKDILAGGFIKRLAFPAELRTKLARSGKQDAPYIYAEAGIWYDALAAISDLIDTSSENLVWQQRRRALLEQVGLSDVASPHEQTGQAGNAAH